MFTQSFRKTALALFAAAAFTPNAPTTLSPINGNSPERGVQFTIDVAEDMNLVCRTRVGQIGASRRGDHSS